MTRRYTDDEVDAILSAALEASPDEGIDHEDLVAAGAEIGLDPDAIARAADRIEARREDEKDVAELTAEARKKRTARFISHLSTFAIVTAFLFAVDLLTGPGIWAHWVLLSWGMLVALQGSRLLQEEPIPKKALKKRRREREKERQRRRKKQSKRSTTDDRLKTAAQALDAVVKERAAELLEALTKRLGDEEEAPEPKGEFAEFVAGQKAGGKANKRELSSPQVRVAPDAEAAADEEAVEEAASKPDAAKTA
ncbi:MAG: 2TM domain-containing protein [Myxococcota bacterium]